MEVNIVKEEEVELLVNELAQLYGYDFTNYARASLRRRINRFITIDRLTSFAELLYRVKNNPDYFTHLVEELTVNVTEMFRDPLVFKIIREQSFTCVGNTSFYKNMACRLCNR